MYSNDQPTTDPLHIFEWPTNQPLIYCMYSKDQPTTDQLHVFKGPITRSNINKNQEVFTLPLQMPKNIYNISKSIKKRRMERQQKLLPHWKVILRRLFVLVVELLFISGLIFFISSIFDFNFHLIAFNFHLIAFIDRMLAYSKTCNIQVWK